MKTDENMIGIKLKDMKTVVFERFKQHPEILLISGRDGERVNVIRKYRFVKAYQNFVMLKDCYGIVECFTYRDIVNGLS